MDSDEPKHERWTINIILEVPLEQTELEESARVGEALQAICDRLVELITQDAEIQRLIEHHAIDLRTSAGRMNRR
jgi:hypothetical protein